MRATLAFTLPDDQAEFDAARLGRRALATLRQIDEGLRSLVKHGQPSDETRRLAEEIRARIPHDLLEA